MTATRERIDPDYFPKRLEELCSHPRKRRLVAWLLWATPGWLGARSGRRVRGPLFRARHGSII